MRTIDVLKKWCKITDPEQLEKEVIRFETAILKAAEDIAKSGKEGATGIEVLPGVSKLLSDLGKDKEKRGGEEKWAICTSCKCDFDSSRTCLHPGENHPLFRWRFSMYIRTLLTLSHLLLRRQSNSYCRSARAQSLRHCRFCDARQAVP